jgi:hypothetical protein
MPVRKLGIAGAEGVGELCATASSPPATIPSFLRGRSLMRLVRTLFARALI